MTWFQIWTIAWQVSMVITPLLIGCAVLWLNSKFVGKIEFAASSKRGDDRHELLRDKVASHDERVKAFDEYIARPPSQHKLFNAITVVQAEVREVAKEVCGLTRSIEQNTQSQVRQFDTLNSYLHTLVERGLK